MQTLQTAITWCTDHWEWVLLVLAFVAQVLQGVTVHFAARHPGVVPVVGVFLEAIGFITSKGCRSSLPGPFGRLKLPLQNVPPPPYGRRVGDPYPPRAPVGDADTRRTRVSGLTLMCLILAGCAHNLEPRRCTHLLGQLGGAALSPWADGDCKKAQVKRDWLVGITAGLAVAGGAGGVGSLFPDEQRYRLAIGVTSAALAIGAAVLTPFIVSSQRNLSDHCVEYKDPMARGGK